MKSSGNTADPGEHVHRPSRMPGRLFAVYLVIVSTIPMIFVMVGLPEETPKWQRVLLGWAIVSVFILLGKHSGLAKWAAWHGLHSRLEALRLRTERAAGEEPRSGLDMLARAREDLQQCRRTYLEPTCGEDIERRIEALEAELKRRRTQAGGSR